MYTVYIMNSDQLKVDGLDVAPGVHVASRAVHTNICTYACIHSHML